MRKILTIISLVFLMIAPTHVSAQQEGIAAVVNEDAITMSDLNDRMHMILLSSGLPNNPEIRQKLLPQVMGSLIEEQLKLQAGREEELSATPEEIRDGFGTIAQQNKLSIDQFQEMIKRSNVNIATMNRQIESQIIWTKVVQKKVRPQITVTDSDIDSKFEQLNASKGETEYRMAEIFLPVESPEDEADMRQLAQKMTAEIQSGAPFQKLAQQFSKSAGAAQGGDMGWMQTSQLPEEMTAVVDTLSKNQVSNPVRSATGYHILYLIDQRQITDETLPQRDQMMGIIGTERLERAQRRYLMDLKSAAFIDNRVQS